MTKKQVRSLKKGGKAAASEAVKTGPAPEKKKAASTVAESPSEKSLPARFIQFLKDVRVEFDKIAWANRKETVTLTVATIALTFFVSSYLGLVDIILSKMVGILIN